MIGIDIEKVERFASWTENKLKRVFSMAEIEYAFKYPQPLDHICGFYCVREALVKALNKNDLVFNKISILHENSGKPYIEINDYMAKICKEYNIKTIEISISHTSEYAVAVAQID